MINLLPYENKKQIIAARMNLILVKCLLFLVFAVIFLIISCTGAYFFLKNSYDSNLDKITNNSTNEKSYDTVISQASLARADILLSNGIIDQQTRYSKLIIGLANLLPSGVILDNLDINDSNISSPITINLFANSSEKCQEILNNFNSSNMFSNTTIVPKTSNPPSPEGYPFLITISTTINGAELI